jgi:phage tail-like protein
MGIYDEFKYTDSAHELTAGTKYGYQPRISYTAFPFVATAVSQDVYEEQIVVGSNPDKSLIFGVKELVRPRVDLTWTTPKGSIQAFRIVRNQDGYPLHEEDGEIILETPKVQGDPVVPAATYFSDQFGATPLTPGRYAYYTIWILEADFTWKVAGYTYCLIPNPHELRAPDNVLLKSSERKFVELFPKVFTTQEQSYLDEVDESSDLFNFLSGFAYSLDEMLTYTDLLTPDPQGRGTNPNFVAVQAAQLGLKVDTRLGIQRQKRMIRNALEMYQKRGTTAGLSVFAESTTGFSPTVSVSPNLLLSAQDSSFYKTTGNWMVSSGLDVTLTSATDVTPVTTEAYAVDTTYTGKVVISSGTNRFISLGEYLPMLTGIPVTEGETYRLAFYLAGSSVAVTPSFTWYDSRGTQITGADGGGSATTPSSTTVLQKVVTAGAVAPTGAKFASIKFKFATAGTFHIDMIQFADTSVSNFDTYYEARAVEVYFSPEKINFLENPSFNEVVGDEDAADWVITGGSGSISYPSTTIPTVQDGSHMLQTATVTGAFAATGLAKDAIATGVFYTFSVYVQTDPTISTNLTETLALNISAFDVDNNPLVDGNGNMITATSSTFTVDNTWQRHQVTMFLPDSQLGAYLQVSIFGNTTGKTLNFDAGQLEFGYSATDYFDGDYATRGASWLGDTDDSISLLYRNKAVKISHLLVEIKDYLPLNTAYVITTGYNGVKAVELSDFSS